ncbi:MAG: serine/threonine-protein kinase, partial [Rhodothermales bacterium]
MNDSTRWDHLKALFEDVCALTAAERPAFMARIDDEALRAEVYSLVQALDADPSFLEEPIDADTFYLALDQQAMDAPGDRIGPYTLVRILGSGGMGTVYLAERTDGQFSRHVALKLARPGDLRRDRLDHLFHERQVLASLQHPNIARLFDGGVAPDGRPFLAMEYVRGLPIDRYCDRQNLTLTQRITLFRSVCAAVQHAHQNLVIHRDLKPSNILVDASGEVKLLDFGIAKLLDDPQRSHQGPVTRTGARLMTLEYASPEQVLGQTITTASDVYALGILLYELLAGVRPYNLTALSPTQIEAAICEHDPPRPSMRPELPERAQRLLRGDLDVIVMNALRKQPERRYASPAHLSEDLLRFTRKLPISARPDTFSYRASTFVRRHRAAVLATALT